MPDPRPTTSRRVLTGLLAATLTVGWLAGCASETERDLRRQITRLEDRLHEQQQELAARANTISALNRQLADARAISPEVLEQIYFPEEIRFASLTAGVNLDDQPGDDGVVVHLQPLDRNRDPLKVAGSVRIDLFDLAAPTGQTLIGRCTYSPEELRERWLTGLLTYHYSLECPWDRLPETNAVTVRAVFTDLLTERVITAQRVVEVQLPPPPNLSRQP
jgi:hypothetical protein